MLIPNNPDLDFQELNRRIEAEVKRYRLDNNERPLPAFNPSPADVYDQTYAWSGLIQLDDEALIVAAYPTLLGRKGEPEELRQGLQQLRSGVDKFQVLAALRYSPEGQAHNAEVFGLRRAHLKNMIMRIPLLGHLLVRAHALVSAPARHSDYMARMNLLSRQHKLQADGLVAHKDLMQQQFDTQQRQLQDQQAYTRELHTYVRNQQEALAVQGKAQQLQAQTFEQLNAELQQARQVEQELRMRLSHLERVPTHSSSSPKTVDTETVSPSNAAHDGLPDSFYLAFENRFRGDAETIRSRLSYYLPLLENVTPLQSGLPLVDIGCGRGEWLQMLAPGYHRLGLDLNAMNVETCTAQGLEAIQQDALLWLENQADSSLAVITAFHVIEHLTFEQFNVLLDQCLRTLAPGGLVIFETPNPENLIVAATNFHTDPTHLHPLPPAFSEFMLQFKGFNQVAIHRLNPIPREFALNEDSEVSRRCDALFYGPQDYAVTASKHLI